MFLSPGYLCVRGDSHIRFQDWALSVIYGLRYSDGYFQGCWIGIGFFMPLKLKMMIVYDIQNGQVILFVANIEKFSGSCDENVPILSTSCISE